MDRNFPGFRPRQASDRQLRQASRSRDRGSVARTTWLDHPMIRTTKTKGDNMKKLFAALLVLMCPPLLAQNQVPVIAFDSVPNLLKLPKNLHLGEVTGVAVNSKGHIFVFSRGNTSGPAYAAAAAQLLEFSPNGKFIREIGKNLYAWSFAHTVRVDKEDNIWITDKGSDLVVKFNPGGQVVMVFGRKQEASDEETGPVKHPKPPLPSRT
jgi:hypothetical protein